MILAPDIALKDYPNLTKQRFLKYPFYNKLGVSVLSYKRYVRILNLVFANKITIRIFTYLFKLIPKVSFVEGHMEAFTSSKKSKYKKELKKIFKPTDVVVDFVDKFIKEKRGLFQVIVGVHIRRGDYQTWHNGKYFYTDEEYNKIIGQLKILFPNKRVGFLICSNEKIYLENFNNKDVFFFKNSSAAIDLYGLGLCDYVVGPPSSYSAWASYYGNIPLYFLKDINNRISLDQFFIDEFPWPPLNIDKK